MGQLASVGSLEIMNNNSLTSWTLPQLSNISGWNSEGLEIRDNDALVQIPPMPSLQSIGGTFTIQNNPELNDVTALHGVGSVSGAMTISDNDCLDNNDALLLRDAIGMNNISGGILIYSNGLNCN